MAICSSVDFAKLMQEPGIHAGIARHFSHAHSALKRKANVAETLWTRGDEALCEAARLQDFCACLLAGFEGTPRLHQRFLEGAADGHDFADGLIICGPSVSSGTGKFF